MTEVLLRLRMDLPRLAPALWDSLRGPADDDVREALRVAVEPMPLPDELDVFLRAHDGQSIGAGWWPTLDSGPLLSGQQIAEEVTWFRSDGEPWRSSAAWVPVTHEQCYQTVIDAVPVKALHDPTSTDPAVWTRFMGRLSTFAPAHRSRVVRADDGTPITT